MKKQIEKGPNIAICQKREETERGWGTRPDGFSLHVSHDALARYIKEYWSTMPKAVPYEYSRPDGTPYEVGVSDEVFARIEASGDGIPYYYGWEYPGSGGVDGWRPMQRD